MANEVPEEKLVTAFEIAQLLKVSSAWVIKHSSPSSKFRIPVLKVGGLLRYDPAEVLQFVRNANETPTPRNGGGGE